MFCNVFRSHSSSSLPLLCVSDIELPERFESRSYDASDSSESLPSTESSIDVRCKDSHDVAVARSSGTVQK